MRRTSYGVKGNKGPNKGRRVDGESGRVVSCGEDSRGTDVERQAVVMHDKTWVDRLFIFF